MNLPKYCFDTHPLVWYFKKEKTLSSNAKEILDSAFDGACVSFLPSIILLEAFDLSLRDKKFIFPQFVKFLAGAKFIIVPLEEEVLRTCYSLPRKINIHDRAIMATARSTGSQLVTKDKVLRSLFPIETIW